VGINSAPPVLAWAIKRKIPTIAVLADSFNKTGLKEWIRKKHLAGMLNKPAIRWVGNHGLNACRSLEGLGVNPEKIIPWDWPASSKPSDFSARELTSSGPFTVLYVGSVSEAKGVGDLLEAAARFSNAIQ
jgi:glycosyltransferase involved in cell wall biosynthesis